MEKVIITLRGDADDAWCEALRTDVVPDLLALDLPGVAINLRDEPVRASLMTLTTLSPPVVGFVSVWTHQYYGAAVGAALDRLSSVAAAAAYLVTESVALAPPVTVPGERTRGFKPSAGKPAGRHGGAERVGSGPRKPGAGSRQRPESGASRASRPLSCQAAPLPRHCPATDAVAHGQGPAPKGN